MTTLVTALNGAPAITSATAPAMGLFNKYNASVSALPVILPALAGLNVGASTWIAKDSLDASTNAVTFTCAGTDTFDDATTAVALSISGENRSLQVITVDSIKYWKITTGFVPPNQDSAPKLSTARKINGVNFDGTADITNACIRIPGFFTNVRAVGAMGTPASIMVARTPTLIRYIPTFAATGTFTVELRDAANSSATITGSGVTSAASDFKTDKASSLSAFTGSEMVFPYITAITGTQSLGLDVEIWF